MIAGTGHLVAIEETLLSSRGSGIIYHLKSRRGSIGSFTYLPRRLSDTKLEERGVRRAVGHQCRYHCI